MSKKSEEDKVNQVKSVAQVVGGMCAFFGVLLLFLTSLFVGELVGFETIPHTRETPFINTFFGTVIFGAMTVFCFALAYGLWRLKKWALYVLAALTFFLFVFVLFSAITDPNFSPFIGLVSLFSGLFLAYLYSVREHFK